jgi:nucleotide-binding universal stress UspA family protein
MKKFLVPTDFSEDSARAVRYAMDLARAQEAELLLYHACFDPMLDSDLPAWHADSRTGQGGELVLNQAEAQARRQMSELEQQIREEARNLKVETRVEMGFAERTIPDVALQEGCDLIVMGTRGKGKVLKTFFGSVTASVMQKASTPVLVVPAGATFASFRHVMYASDFDPTDGVIVRQMLETLQPLQFDLYTVFIYNDHGHPYRKEDYQGLKEALQSHMHQVIPDARMDIIATGNHDLVQGLKQQLKEKEVDLLVMTTHARNFITRLMQPSQTKRMMFQTDTPLMVFRVVD